MLCCGNVVDLAVGVIIGGAFQGIVQSVVNDLVMPIVGMIWKTDFSSLYIRLFSLADHPEATGASLAYVRDTLGLPVFAYGNFLTQLINFLIMAFVIFLLVKGLNSLSRIKLPHMHQEQEEKLPSTKICPFCKSEIAYTAVRCPHCTSLLESEERTEEEKSE